MKAKTMAYSSQLNSWEACTVWCMSFCPQKSHGLLEEIDSMQVQAYKSHVPNARWAVTMPEEGTDSGHHSSGKGQSFQIVSLAIGLGMSASLGKGSVSRVEESNLHWETKLGLPGDEGRTLTSVTLTTPICGADKSMSNVFSQYGTSCGEIQT